MYILCSYCFISEHTYVHIPQMIAAYQSTIGEISGLDKVALFPMARLDCEQANSGLVDKAEGCLTRLHNSLAKYHMTENQRYVGDSPA